MTVIDEYLQTVDPQHRPELERIRAIVHKLVPGAQETVSYAMPAFRYKGHVFLGFQLHKNHIGIYPFGAEVIEVLHDQLSKFELSKGTIRVSFDSPISEDILKQIINYRLNQINQLS